MTTIKNQSFKITIGTAVAVIIATVVFFVNANDRMKDCESAIKHLNGKTDLYAERYDSQIEKQNELELKFVEINTKLLSIETILSEIKADLKSY